MAEISRQCDRWTVKHDILSLASVSNAIFVLLFTVPSLFALSPKWFRICALVAYIFGLFTSLHYCDPISSIFATFFILANIIRLSPTFFDDAKLPTHLRPVYEEIFQSNNINIADFILLTKNSHVMEVSNQQIVYSENDLKESPMSISLLLDGQLTAKVDGKTLHTISRHHFLDSVEWKDFVFEKNICIDQVDNQEVNIQRKKFQVELVANKKSTYLLFNGQQLDFVKKENPNLFYIFDAIICRDITFKLYSINDANMKKFDNESSSCATSIGNHPLLRSMSVDCLQTASNGRIVSENWLKGRNRIFTLKCLHDENDNQITPNGMIVPKLEMATNQDVAYLIHHSHPKIIDRYGEEDVIPSLTLQSKYFDPESCRFRSNNFIREVDWSKSMEHCGLCIICRPLPDGEPEKTSSRPTGHGI